MAIQSGIDKLTVALEITRADINRTRSILCLPAKNQQGDVFAVAQLLNRKDGKPFDREDEVRFAKFIESIGVIFEALEDLSSINSPTGA